MKKKKGPKKGTKYKKRATAAPDAGGVALGLAPKYPKMTKKAAAAAAAAVAAAAASSQDMAHVRTVGRFAFQNTQIDLGKQFFLVQVIERVSLFLPFAIASSSSYFYFILIYMNDARSSAGIVQVAVLTIHSEFQDAAPGERHDGERVTPGSAADHGIQ